MFFVRNKLCTQIWNIFFNCCIDGKKMRKGLTYFFAKLLSSRTWKRMEVALSWQVEIRIPWHSSFFHIFLPYHYWNLLDYKFVILLFPELLYFAWWWCKLITKNLCQGQILETLGNYCKLPLYVYLYKINILISNSALQGLTQLFMHVCFSIFYILFLTHSLKL